jgi:ethanolamine-phosphate cytidylyltransferase
LIVGIHGDALVNKLRGMNLPLMNLHERVMSVLGCRYVDDVLIDAPYMPTKAMIETLNISELVVRKSQKDGPSKENDDELNRFQNAESAGILRYIDVPNEFDIRNTIQRIQRNHESFQARYEKKKSAEQQFYCEKRATVSTTNGTSTGSNNDASFIFPINL